jgi:hypothetical protein
VIINAIRKIREALSGVFLIAGCVLLRPIFHSWYVKWGTTSTDINRKLPGDEYISCLRGGYTQAIDINASPGAVWPWIVQMGQDKAGFYSYELLENMIGCNIHNAAYIINEYQNIKVGDRLIMHPKAPTVPVIIVKPVESMVYGGKQDENTANVWVFNLDEKEETTHLITRWSFDYKPGLFNKAIYNWFIEPIAAVMQRKMLLEVKKLVEMRTGQHKD